MNYKKIQPIINQARDAAIKYYRLTGKPLGVTGEIGEFEAAKKLNLELAEARAAGFDAIDKIGRKIQIKTRYIPGDKRMTGQRIGAIKFDHTWDCVVLVLLDDEYKPKAMYETGRRKLKTAVDKTKSKSRQRGALALTEFISLGKQV